MDLTHKRKNAGLKAAETKGEEERKRAALMAAWTKAHGKNDATNPYSKEKYYADKAKQPPFRM